MDKLKKILSEALDDDIRIDIGPKTSLRNDLGFDSLKLAHLTVLIEDEFGVDIFEDGNVDTLNDVIDKIGSEKLA